MHYSDEPVVFDRAKTYDQSDETHGHLKPVGLWVSVQGEDDWPAWCRQEEFWPEGLEHPHRVILRDEANILRIDTPDGINGFHAKYAEENEFNRMMARIGDDNFRRNQWPINWGKVATEYDGLIIAPYQWSRRLGPIWYYGWDCASGCIWNLEAIASFEAP